MCGRPAVRMHDAAEPVRVLDRHQPNAARRGVQQHRAARAQPRAASAACTVLHVIGSVHAASNESAAGLGASQRPRPRATLASGAAH